SSTPATHTNQMQISQYAVYSGPGYGYASGTGPWLPFNSGAGSAVINLSGIPAGATIKAAFLETVQLVQSNFGSCYNSQNINGTSITGINTGYANLHNSWFNPSYNTTTIVTDTS